MGFPVFASGDVLNASDMNAVGLWLVKTQTVGTGVASVTVTGAFSADYDNYKVIYEGGVGSTNITIDLQLGASTTGYNMSLPYVVYGSGTPAGTSIVNGARFSLAGYGTVNYATVNLDILGPNKTQYTRVMGAYVGELESGSYGGVHKVNAAYTAFTMTSNFGTMTGGTIRVYGYRN